MSNKKDSGQLYLTISIEDHKEPYIHQGTIVQAMVKSVHSTAQAGLAIVHPLGALMVWTVAQGLKPI